MKRFDPVSAGIEHRHATQETVTQRDPLLMGTLAVTFLASLIIAALAVS